MIRCKPDEFAIFNPPDGQTCAAWGQDFVNKFGGYIDNLNATVACRYCQFAVGDEFFLPLNIEFGKRWRDAFILFSYFGEGFQCTAALVNAECSTVISLQFNYNHQ